MAEPLIYVLIFVGVFATVEGLYLLAYGGTLKREKKVSRRLARLMEGRDPEGVQKLLRAVRETEARQRRVVLVGRLVEMARHASLPISPLGMALLLLALSGLCFGLLGLFAGSPPAVRALASVVLAYGGVFLWLRDKAQKRVRLFEEQLPDALDLMVRSLRVGHPINAAIGIVAREMPDPLGAEFGLVADEATYGMTINLAIERVAERVPVPDLRFLAIAMNIQSTSGGNLAEILGGLSNVIRSRFKLLRKVKAITSEARWSGWFLSIFPFVALALVQIIQPDYYDEVADHPLFVPGVVLTFALLICNVIFMRLLIAIKI